MSRGRCARDADRGCGGAASDAGLGIAVDEEGRAAYLTGSTQSSHHPISAGAAGLSYNGAGDGILAKFAMGPGASDDG